MSFKDADEGFRRRLNWERTPGARYPFTDMPREHLVDLSNRLPSQELWESPRPINHNESYIADADPGLFVHIMATEAVCRWLHSPRKIVSVSNDSADALLDWEPRFGDLPPAFTASDEPWRDGTLFILDWPRTGSRSIAPGVASINNERRVDGADVAAYVEPHGEELGVRFMIWARDIENKWCEVADRVGSNTYTAVEQSIHQYVGARVWKFDAANNVRTRQSKLGILNDAGGTRIPIHEILIACINTLAAIHAEPTVIHGTRKLGRKRNKRIGPINRVRKLTLEDHALSLVTRRWTTLPPDETDEPTDKVEYKNRKSPCEHPVDPHYWRPWVNAPKVDETVLETRQRTRVRKGKVETYTQYRVKRWRSGCKRGEGIKPKVSHVVTGPGDLGVEA